MKKVTFLIVSFSLVTSIFVASTLVNAQALYTAPTVDTMQDFHIDKDGYVKIAQAKVFQVSGTTFYVRYYVGLAFIRLIVKTEKSTKAYRRFGDEITLNQIYENDSINIEGKIENGSDTLSIIASKLTNFSNQKEVAGFKGIISGMGSTTGSLILTTQNQGTITVATDASTQIRKGSRIISIDLVRNGDHVTDTTGTYDHKTKTLDANVIVIYTDMSIYRERNFEGTLKEISGGNANTIIFNTEGVDYKIAPLEILEVMNKKRGPVSLKRFVAGDTIRVYGKIRETEEPIIDAEVIRNLNL